MGETEDDTYSPFLDGFKVVGFSFFRGSLVTRWEAPGGFGASSGLWLANFSFIL